MHCEKFSEFLFGADTNLYVGCISCMEGYVDVGGFCVADLTQSNYACNVENCLYCVQNNYCGKCKEGYHTQQYTGGLCFKNYSPIPNC